ncbi:MAG TPA: discoidin domain-containing protein [Polyangiaceae bacterium]|nr:discoidin domain-containing protein [Polyangiaceae bacterium]
MLACATYDNTNWPGNDHSSIGEGDEQAGDGGAAEVGTSTGGTASSAGSPNSAGTSDGARGGGASAGVGGLSSTSEGGAAGGDAGSAGKGGSGQGGSGQGGSGQGGSGQGGSVGNGGSGQGGSVGNGGRGGAGGGATVELARGKATTASTEESGNPSSLANDGVSTTRWAANSGALPQWWRVDLGRVCTLQSYSLTFQWPDREYSYTIETSTDGSAFANLQAKSGTGLQTGAFPATQARYVRVTVTASNPASFASLFEVSIQGY